MADNESESKPKGSKKTLFIVLPLVLLAGGAGFYMFMARGKAEKEKAKAEESDTEFGPTLAMETFIVNLNEPGARYLKMKITLETTEKIPEEELRGMLKVRDKYLVLLSGYKVVDIQSVADKVKLKEKLKELANEALGREIVKNVYFEEFVIQ